MQTAEPNWQIFDLPARKKPLRIGGAPTQGEARTLAATHFAKLRHAQNARLSGLDDLKAGKKR